MYSSKFVCCQNLILIICQINTGPVKPFLTYFTLNRLVLGPHDRQYRTSRKIHKLNVCCYVVSWVVVRNIIKVRVIIETEDVVEELKIGLGQFSILYRNFVLTDNDTSFHVIFIYIIYIALY